MGETEQYYVVRERALSEVLLRVVEAKKLLEQDHGMSIQQAAERVGISRSSFYKYKDDIHLFHDRAKGKTVTFFIQMEDAPGHLASVLSVIAKYKANILTIHQSVPVNYSAALTISIEIQEETEDLSGMIGEVERLAQVYSVKIV